MAIPDDVTLQVREAGFGPPQPPPVGELPAGGGKWVVPTHLTKVGLINQLARSYFWASDEALRNSMQNSLAMLRDVDIRDAIDTRVLPTCQLAWILEPQDPTDPQQLAATKKLDFVIRQTPRLTAFHKSNLWAIWFGKSATQLTFKWDYSQPDGERRMLIKNHRNIHGDSLVPRWDDEWGVLVNGLFDGTREPTNRGFAHFFTPAEREAVIVHVHESIDSSYFEPEMAGSIAGSGVRGGVFWTWYIASNLLALIADWSERCANGLWKAYFDQSNPEGQQTMAAALSAYRNNNVLELPQTRDGQRPFDVIIDQIGTASPMMIFELYQYLRSLIRKYITGTNVSIETSIGIGGDAAGIESDRISRVVKFDAEQLAETYSTDLLPTLCRYNCGPLVPPPRWKFLTDRPNAGEIIGYAKSIRDLGGDIDLTPLYEAAGLSLPSPGSNISSKLQPLSPTAVDNTPQQVPIAGQPGPMQQPQQVQVAAAQPPQQQQMPPTVAA